ncbi:hypothetical protein E2562_027466 [Oryza meyeriana var. granulata]|uniref:Uncharacterized protein n=1 Tax=Oryza meyeriana var. granulata TaxID=110450 RepID=A0A6G1CJ40_9ORYZ|nr:hypothetical protein E2562_027466 [Oryza meyeriana var. granulata]
MTTVTAHIDGDRWRPGRLRPRGREAEDHRLRFIQLNQFFEDAEDHDRDGVTVEDLAKPRGLMRAILSVSASSLPGPRLPLPRQPLRAQITYLTDT